MRKILFRGKSVNDGEWVHGSLVITTIEPADDTPIKHYHIEDMTIGVFPNEHQSGFSETVDPETVGQFTGLTDRNGKKIFEGDILKRTNGNKYVWYVDYKNCAFCANQSNCNYACELGELLDQIELEVIGNIHDNSEMMEGK